LSDLTKNEKRHLNTIEKQIDCLMSMDGWTEKRIKAYITLSIWGVIQALI